MCVWVFGVNSLLGSKREREKTPRNERGENSPPPPPPTLSDGVDAASQLGQGTKEQKDPEDPVRLAVATR
jgi:hypothetical protein